MLQCLAVWQPQRFKALAALELCAQMRCAGVLFHTLRCVGLPAQQLAPRDWLVRYSTLATAFFGVDYATLGRLLGPPNAGRFSADTCLSTGETNFPQLAQNEAFVEAKAVVAGVRACGGSWTSYCRLPHKELLRLRSLILRGRARPRREPITARRVAAHRSITFLLCKLGDNGVVWKILEFWQATR